MKPTAGEGLPRAWVAAALAIVLVAGLQALAVRRAAALVDDATVETVLAELADEPSAALPAVLARHGIEADPWASALRRWAGDPARLRRFRAATRSRTGD